MNKPRAKGINERLGGGQPRPLPNAQTRTANLNVARAGNQRHLAVQPMKAARATVTPPAPPVYRPQPTPKVLQRKIANPPAAQIPVKPKQSPPPPGAFRPPRQPVAAPAYRPQPVPRVLQQMKKTTANQSSARSSPPSKPPAMPFASRPNGPLAARKVILPKRLPSTAERPPVIQRKIKLTPSYTRAGKVKDAYDTFLESFKKDRSYDYFRDSDKVIVWFGTGNEEPEAHAYTSHGIHTEAVKEEMVGKKIIGKRVDLRFYNRARNQLPPTSEIVYRVVLSDSYIQQLSAPVLATILAHEVGAHVIPHYPQLQKMERGEELTQEEQQYFVDIHETDQRPEHLAIRNLTNAHYEDMVRDMVGSMSHRDARAASEHYLNDISRYDERGEAFSLDAYDWALNYRIDKPRLENWQSRRWLRAHVPEPELRWTPAQKTLGAAVVAAAAVGAYFLKYGRKSPDVS